MKSRLLLPVLTVVVACSLPTADGPEAADPKKADADFPVQGEYVGELETDKWGAQVIALGDGKFATVGYAGGLPGDGWDGDREALVRGTGETKDGRVVLTAASGRFSGVIEKGVLKVLEAGTVELGQLKQVERRSPTQGAVPPEGAMVLFDGTNTGQWRDGARMTEDGLLLQGATTKAEFQDFTLHLEFRTPYQPKARGQGRGNSGVYAQGRHEIQILDSFGLNGEANEAGAIYGVKAPSINMCFPPLQWQTYDIEFTAARYDATGAKSANPRITVRHNGVEVQKATEVALPTTAAPVAAGPAAGPILLQDHGNPVRFRNIWIVPKK